MRHTAKILISLLPIFLIGCKQNSQNDKQNVNQVDTNKKLRLLTYGEPPDMERQSAENVIAEKWGIEYFGVAGCVVSKELIDSVNKHNKEVNVLINNKYGKSWQNIFNKEVEEELIKQKVASSLINKEKIIINKQNELEMEGNGLHYRFQPINKNEYKVSASGWGKIKERDEYVSYFRYLVNIEDKKVKLMSDSLIKE